MKSLSEILAQHKAGRSVGIYAACSAHPIVMEAALCHARRQSGVALIEATSNQVNQDGGYTGMRPADFSRFVLHIAEAMGVPQEQVLLGGDHLGPNCWQDLPAEAALTKSEQLVAEYVAAGFRKIHLDCSMSCADDPTPLTDAAVAARAARLCKVAEHTWRRVGGAAPVYVVGTEVPVPGGATHTLSELALTEPRAVTATIDAHWDAFQAAGLHHVWSRVIGLVVQPGVEFDHHNVIDFQAQRAADLATVVETQPHMVYEAHSTDYQTPANLRALVQHHFAILKVGPGLTFAMREALWALDQVEREWLGLDRSSRLRETILGAMTDTPRFWSKYYLSEGRQLILDQEYSLSDRIRYYWPVPAVESALNRLLANLDANPPPLTLLAQHLPVQYQAIREGRMRFGARELVRHHIEEVLQHYSAACSDAAAGGER
jgi:D-tagatose-1,6-bisphosphate aldolase subunit GatZ/KbaZ